MIWMICPTFLCAFIGAQNTLRIISYNVENFFHPDHDSLKNDFEFTPDGNRHWSYTRYNTKAENISRVIANTGEWNTPAIIGLCEIENEKCVKKLCWLLKNYQYQYIHYESPDERGIDVAVLYHPELFQLIESQPIRVPLDSASSTRDILYASGIINHSDTLHIFVCHLPSQLSGKKVSDWKRKKAKDILRFHVDSLLQINSQAKIIVMGDMNASPENDIQGLHNLMTDYEKNGHGTHKYKGKWSCLDQFYVSDAVKSISSAHIYDAAWIQEKDNRYLGLKPKRTFTGYRYQKGYSDHLPIYLDLYK